MPSGDGLDGLDAAEVQSALDELLAWEPMRRSPQLSAFLRYIVEARLRGDEASLKAYSIAVDVLGRGEAFDPQTDPIVRVQARRLRSLMATFYASGYSQAPVQIELPVGRYIPEFRPRAQKQDDTETARVPSGQTSGEPPRNIWIIGIIALSVLGAAIIFWPSFSERTATIGAIQQPAMPLVIVEEFENLASDAQGAPLVAGLAVELVTDLNQFPDIVARYGGMQAALSPAETALETPVYLLSGITRRVSGGVQYGVVLKDGMSGNAVANLEVIVAFADGQPEMSIDDVARHIVLKLGGPRSVVHRPARDWLTDNQDIPLAHYPCLVAFFTYMERYTERAMSVARMCAEQNAPSHPDAQAVLATLLADAAWLEGVETEAGIGTMTRAQALASEARDRDATSSLAWMALGRVAFFSGRLQDARDYLNSAYQLNPAAADTVAGYAHVLGSIGNWQAAMALSEEVLSAEETPPDWYYLAPALYALRSGDYAQAIDFASLSLTIYPEMSSAILVAAGAASGNTQIVNAYLPRLLAGQGYRRLGILPTLRFLISDTELLRQLSNGISMAGVPLDRLTRPF